MWATLQSPRTKKHEATTEIYIVNRMEQQAKLEILLDGL